MRTYISPSGLGMPLAARDGVLYGLFGSTLVYSTDGWQTTQPLDVILRGGLPRTMRVTDSGALIASMAYPLYDSASGYATVFRYQNRVTEVLDFRKLPGGSRPVSWSIGTHGNMVAVAPYGGEGDATKTYVSTDDGQTFHAVFDFSDDDSLPPGGINTMHNHACGVDPYTGLIWVCAGDGPRRIYTLDPSDGYAPTVMSTDHQPTAIFFTEDHVIFGQDAQPYNGVLVYDRNTEQFYTGISFAGTPYQSHPVMGTMAMGSDGYVYCCTGRAPTTVWRATAPFDDWELVCESPLVRGRNMTSVEGRVLLGGNVPGTTDDARAFVIEF